MDDKTGNSRVDEGAFWPSLAATAIQRLVSDVAIIVIREFLGRS
jgi:hypothetical protein